ncbi:MAG: helix-turn-helix transcriptional regulator, partial [Chlorobiales bacterium]|nr:helix-turn-helix transcriptional regulator [Chlorobiales bacterium]
MSKSLLKRVMEKISPQKRNFVKRQGEIAVRIAELLTASGMTQRELAEKLGKKESYVSRVLRMSQPLADLAGTVLPEVHLSAIWPDGNGINGGLSMAGPRDVLYV